MSWLILAHLGSFVYSLSLRKAETMHKFGGEATTTAVVQFSFFLSKVKVLGGGFVPIVGWQWCSIVYGEMSTSTLF
jgi:hypothetical protein